MKLADLFKQKPGGTKLGNLARQVAHTYNPMLGNGALMKKEGETDAEAAAKLNDAAETAAKSAVLGVNTKNWFKTNWKKVAIWGGSAVTLVGIIIAWVKHSRNKNKFPKRK